MPQHEGVHIYITWQIRLNDPCPVALWAITVITVAICICY